MPEFVTRGEFTVYADQQGRILDTLEKLLTNGIQGVQDRQDETNAHLIQLNGKVETHAKAIVSLGQQNRKLFRHVDGLEQSVAVINGVELPSSKTRWGAGKDMLKKKETYIGGAAFVAIVELLKEITPAIVKALGYGG